MKLSLRHLLMTSALAAVLAPVASAQDNPFERGRHTAVTERGQPEYDPEPIRAGGFNINSSLALSAEYNDNVFAQPVGEIDDTIFRIRPRVDAQSTWSVHALFAGAEVDHREYQDQDSESSTDYNVFVGGRLDATRNLNFTGRLTAGHATEPRYEPGSNAPEPAQNDYVGAEAGASFRSDRILLEGQVGTRENDYQDFYPQRDVNEKYVGGRASYAVSPDVAVFAQARKTDLDYEPGFGNRDGSQTNLQIGTSFELSAPFRGEISVGQVTDERDAAGVDDAESFSLDALLVWFPTQLTTVTFRGNSGISDPGIAEALSANTQYYSVRVDHELLRNVLLFGQFGLGNYEYNAAPAFPGFDREDSFYDVSVGAAYKLNKHAHLELGYNMHHRETESAIGTEMDQNILSIGVRVFP